MNTFQIPQSWTNRRVKIAVVGAGGTGSQIVKGLAKLHLAITSLGHPEGLEVTVWDDDLVSQANIGRQEFYDCDVGLPKSVVLVHRINMAMGLNWEAQVDRYGSTHHGSHESLIIGCVDSRASRRAILDHAPSAYWFDLGNREEDGQCVFGKLPIQYGVNDPDRLPHVADLFPEIVNAKADAEDDAPSCSLAEALEKQGLFVNSIAANWGLNLLWQLFRHGEISHHGVFFNTRTGRSNPLAIDPNVWKAMGYNPRARKKKAA